MEQCRYEQVAKMLEQNIRQGIWPVGTKIPGEIELAKTYHVGRSTIRETLNILQQKGMVQKKHGSGTYVTEPKKNMENPLLTLNSMGEMIKEAGYTPHSVFYGVSHEVADLVLSHKLKLKEDERIVIVNRGRTADEQPVVFSYNVFPEKIVGHIFDQGLKGSIFKVLREKCEVSAVYALTEIKGIDLKNAWDVKAADFLKGPIVLMEQLHFDQAGTPILYSFDYIRTDLVTLHLRRE